MLTAPAAYALDPEITSDTAAQFYDVRSPTGETVLARRRLTTTLGVSTYDLIPHDHTTRNGPELSFRARMRYDADYGANGAEADAGSPNSLVPGFSRGPVDLMYGYLEGRKLAGGWLGFKLGRQYMVDSLGWWSFDGGEVKITTPYYFSTEVYGGLEVRGGMPLSTPRFERDGIWRGDRSGYDPSLYPSFQPSDVAPAMGAAIESAGVTWLHGRLSYRRVYNTGSSNVSEYASGLIRPVTYDGTRISQERIGYSFDATMPPKMPQVAGLKGGVSYDFYNAKVATIYGSLDGYVSQRLTVSVDYDYYAPTYDADSIWNFFAGEPMNDIGARADLNVSDTVSIAGGGHVRIFEAQTSPFTNTASPNLVIANNPNYFPTNGSAFDEGFNAAIRHKNGENIEAVRASGNFGKDGDRVGGDISLEHVLYSRYIAEGRTGLWHWNDKLRPDRDAVGFQAVAGVGYKLAPRSRVLFEYELDVNRLVGLRNRAMVWLNVAVTK